jgi:hypothetical protein
VLLQGFSRGILPVGLVHVSTGFGDAHATGTIRVQRIPRGVAARRAPPSLGPFEAIGVDFSSCSKRVLAVSPRDGG